MADSSKEQTKDRLAAFFDMADSSKEQTKDRLAAFFDMAALRQEKKLFDMAALRQEKKLFDMAALLKEQTEDEPLFTRLLFPGERSAIRSLMIPRRRLFPRDKFANI